MPKGKQQSDDQVDEAHVESTDVESPQLEQLEQELAAAKESERRAVADYQNLVRRHQHERAQFVKFATRELVGDMLQPLDHLSLAAAQLNDNGLNMVISQFWQKLEEHGLKKIDVLGKHFDAMTMEVVEKDGQIDDAEAEDLVVTQVHRQGYTLNGEVIQVARVVMGQKK